MKLNYWKFYYAKDESFKYDEKKLFEKDLANYSSFESVKTPCLFEDIIKDNHLLGDCYLSTNLWDYAQYEDVHQFYVAHFKKGYNFIKLLGVDTIADIYVNGELIGKTNNQFMPFEFALKNLKKDNELIIHIYPNTVMGRKYDLSKIKGATRYTYESIFLRKTTSSFGWDILPRTCLGGIFDEVLLLKKQDLIKEFLVKSSFKSLKDVTLSFSILLNELNGDRYEINGQCSDSAFSYTGQIDNAKINANVQIDNPYLWTIRGYGNQYLYDIKLSIYKQDKLIATKSIKYGIRKITLKRSSIVEENGSFEFYINEQKVFLLGSNYVPIDALKHIDDTRSQKALKLLMDIGCNAIRIWGGGTYESDKFYQTCDKLGIFIWHDFMMGCAIYPWEDEEFCSRLKIEVEYETKRLINHASICLWAGDNEDDLCAYCWNKPPIDPNLNTITRNLIPDVLSEIDGTRPYIPSSPYLDEVGFTNTDKLSEDHLWGPRDYFKGNYYKNAYPYFTSETGYHALNSPKSLKRFINKPWPLFIDEDKPTKEYLCHATQPVDDYDGAYAYRIKLLDSQIRTLFTKVPKTLNKYALASQISQAEAMKYFIEKMRKDYQRNGGIIWWNIIDGWPEISDAVVDYYFTKKVAYHYIKRSQADTLMMLDENNNDMMDLYISSSLSIKHSYTYRIFDAYDNKILTEGKIDSLPHGSILIETFKNDNKQHFYIIEYYDENNHKYLNHFYTNIINIDFEKYVKTALKYKLIKTEGF